MRMVHFGKSFRMSRQSENDDCRADWKRSGTQVKQNDIGHASEEIYRISDNLSILRLKKMISNFQLDESGNLYYHVA